MTKITKNQIADQEAWIAPTLLNSWVNFGSGFDNAAYMKDSLGFVHFKGMVKSGTLSSTIFTLPAGYRPSAVLYMVAVSSSTMGILNISPTGTVTQDAGNNTYMSLSNVVFKAEQ